MPSPAGCTQLGWEQPFASVVTVILKEIPHATTFPSTITLVDPPGPGWGGSPCSLVNPLLSSHSDLAGSGSIPEGPGESCSPGGRGDLQGRTMWLCGLIWGVPPSFPGWQDLCLRRLVLAEGIAAPNPAVNLQLPVVLLAVPWEQSSCPAASMGSRAPTSRWH